MAKREVSNQTKPKHQTKTKIKSKPEVSHLKIQMNNYVQTKISYRKLNRNVKSQQIVFSTAKLKITLISQPKTLLNTWNT